MPAIRSEPPGEHVAQSGAISASLEVAGCEMAASSCSWPDAFAGLLQGYYAVIGTGGGYSDDVA
jgi:hypothetical protein